jgi:hypothetical protein
MSTTEPFCVPKGTPASPLAVRARLPMIEWGEPAGTAGQASSPADASSGDDASEATGAPPASLSLADAGAASLPFV